LRGDRVDRYDRYGVFQWAGRLGSERFVEIFATGVWNNITDSTDLNYDYVVEYPLNDNIFR